MAIIQGRGRALIPASAITLLGSSTSTSMPAVTVSAAVNVGDIIFAIAGGSVMSGGAFSWTDTKSNTYTSDIAGTGTNLSAIGHCRVTTALVSGTDSIQAAISTAVNGPAIAFFKVTPESFILPPALDGTAASQGTSGSAAAGTVTPTTDPTFGILTAYTPTSAALSTPGGGWASRYNISNGSNSSMGVASLVKADKVGVNNAYTLSTNGWSAAQAFFKLAIQPFAQGGTHVAVTAATR